MKRYFILLLVLASLAACKKSDKSDAYGNFEAIEVTISSQANGQILFLNILEGDLAKAGDTLGLVDTVDLSLKRQQLVKNLNVMEARLRSIRSQIDVQEQQKQNLLVEKARLDKLFKDGAATQKQMDDMTGNLDLVNTQIQATRVQEEGVYAERAALEIQIGQVEESISKCLVISPINGTVLTKFAEAGEVTSFGKPMLKLADLTQMELKVYVSGDQLPYLKIGEKVKVMIDKNRKDLQEMSGVVSWISSTAEFTPKTIQTREERVNLVYAAKIIVPNDGTLKIGMPGEIDFMPAD